MNEATVTIETDPERVWSLVTDITRMGQWSPESTGGRWARETSGAAPGAQFVGFNARGWVRWRTHCRVVECERPRRFAFTVAENGMTWGWRLEPEGTGTRLTQWRERSTRAPLPVRALLATGVLGRDRETMMVDGMHRTLAAVKAQAEHAG